jgi:tRNA (cmo5U34)-methyltransferase
MKSTVDEIRARFDNDVERFSNLETGQTATMDAPLALRLVAEAAASVTPHAQRLLDVGCGAGNFSLRLLPLLAIQEVTLVDLSGPMLQRAEQRIRAAQACSIRCHQADIRELPLAPDSFDIVLAGAVLHHLRADGEWDATFAKLHRCLASGGSIWIFDMVTHPHPAIQRMMQGKYGQYLCSLKDEAYRDHVLAYIEKEDTPRPLAYQLELLARVGFTDVDVLHYNTCFAAFGVVKPRR